MGFINRFVEEAIKQSVRSVERYKHGAIIFDGKGNIISRGFNHVNFRLNLKKYGYSGFSTHAECSAIIKCERDLLEGSSLLVIRRSMGGTKLSSSMPCRSCLNMIIEAGISKVYYSNTDGSISEIRL